MATIRKQKSGRWRAQVRRKGRAISETFLRYQDAKDWATDREREIDRGEAPRSSRIAGLRTFGDLIDLHIDDMKEVKAPRRTKEATLLALKRELGEVKITDLDRDQIVAFGRERIRQGAGPTTIGIDVGFIKLAPFAIAAPAASRAIRRSGTERSPTSTAAASKRRARSAESRKLKVGIRRLWRLTPGRAMRSPTPRRQTSLPARLSCPRSSPSLGRNEVGGPATGRLSASSR
jgi:hypothetical protein